MEVIDDSDLDHNFSGRTYCYIIDLPYILNGFISDELFEEKSTMFTNTMLRWMNGPQPVEELAKSKCQKYQEIPLIPHTSIKK